MSFVVFIIAFMAASNLFVIADNSIPFMVKSTVATATPVTALTALAGLGGTFAGGAL